MGCDGGTIPKRCELVREKKKPEKVDKEIELNAKWCHCAISQEELREPIVSCELGHLYRKEAVLEYLLDKSSATSDISRHIRSLKDVKELVLTKKNEKAKKSGGHTADTYLDFQASDYICAIAGIEMNGRYRFCFSWKCGCVFSERGLKEVPSSVCHNCATAFSEEDIVVINGKEEDVEKLREKMQARRQKAKEERKAKKSKRAVTVESGEDIGVDNKKQKVDQSDGQTTASSSTSVMESKVKGTKPKSSTATSTATSTKSKASSSTQGSDATLTYTKYKSVAENPDASKVFKSLFSSSSKDKPKQRQSNWVTYHSYHC